MEMRCERLKANGAAEARIRTAQLQGSFGCICPSFVDVAYYLGGPTHAELASRRSSQNANSEGKKRERLYAKHVEMI